MKVELQHSPKNTSRRPAASRPSSPFELLKRGKTDAGDAEAIWEAVTRPTMRFVPIKSVEQQEDARRLGPSQSLRCRRGGCKLRAAVDAHGPAARSARTGDVTNRRAVGFPLRSVPRLDSCNQNCALAM